MMIMMHGTRNRQKRRADNSGWSGDLMNQILFRTLMDEPENEPFLRGLISRAIKTGRDIERMELNRENMLQEPIAIKGR